MGNPRRTSCFTLRWVQADSKAQTTFPLDERTPVFNGTCWSVAGEDYEASDWAQSRGRKEEDPHHREARQTQQERIGHSESWTSRSEPRGINSHRQGATIPYSNLDSGATLSIYMDDILITELAQLCRSRNHPVPSPETSSLPGQSG
jgi:hypothetical protein